MSSISYLHKDRMLSVSTVESLPDSPDVIVHQPAEAQAGDAREPHEHVDGGVGVQAPGQQRTNRGADGAAAVNDGGDGGDGLARALINNKQLLIARIKNQGKLHQKYKPLGGYKNCSVENEH